MRNKLARWTLGAVALLGFQGTRASAQADPLPGPDPIPEVKLGPTLPTHPIKRTAGGFVKQANGKQAFNEQWVDASLLPRDKQGIWVLDVAFRPIRILNVEIPGKGRRQVHYMYYQVVNRTGKPRMFVPQFSLVTDTNKRCEDTVIPVAVNLIQTREDPTIPLLGAVNVMGEIPPSTKEGVDDAVFGVAIWEGVDPNADKFSVYIRGLSDGFQQVPGPDGNTIDKYKTLRVDFIRRGDAFQLHEREIKLLNPPYEWIYW